MLAPDHTSGLLAAQTDLHVAIAMALAGNNERVKQLISTAHQKLTEICADEFQKSSEQRNAVIFLVTQAEMAVETGRLSENHERRLRHHIARVCKLFDIPSIAERAESGKVEVAA